MGDAVVILDADLQDPPELIPAFVEKYTEGYDVVYGRRISREGETWFKTFTARLFYRAMAGVGPVQLPSNVGDFRLISRRVNDALLSLPERHRFMKGLFAWVGYPSTAIDYDRQPRFAGQTKWNYLKLLGLSVEGITSFTIFPLRVVTIVGFFLALAAVRLRRLRFHPHADLWRVRWPAIPTLLLTMLLLGGRRADRLGVMGEYLGRVFNEVKGRRSTWWRASAGRTKAAHDAPGSIPRARDEIAMTSKRHVLLRVGRFSIVGALNTLVDIAVFMALLKLFAVPLVTANLLAFAVALANSYVMNRLWTFGDSTAPHDLATISRFLSCNVAGALLATAALAILARVGLPVLAAKVLSIAVSMVWNYLTMRHLVFRPPSSPE